MLMTEKTEMYNQNASLFFPEPFKWPRVCHTALYFDARPAPFGADFIHKPPTDQVNLFLWQVAMSRDNG